MISFGEKLREEMGLEFRKKVVYLKISGQTVLFVRWLFFLCMSYYGSHFSIQSLSDIDVERERKMQLQVLLF